MIGYLTIGTNDLETAGNFYDELLSIMGASRFMADNHIIIWSIKPGEGMFAVITPNDKKIATTGNGSMVAFEVKDFDMIKKMHEKVLELGGTNEGNPGPRGENHYFAYARDLEGHKLSFYCAQE